MSAFAQPLAPVRDLDEVARRYPARKLSLDRKREPLEFYGSGDSRAGGFSMDSLEFFFLISQFYREALPLRIILLLIACQRAGGRVHLTQDEMATVLDVARTKINDSLREIMSHGICYRVKRGVYQLNPPYSYRLGEYIPGTETTGVEYRRVDQHETIAGIRADLTLPELVRYPSLDHMRQAIEELRRDRARKRAERRNEHAQQLEEGTDQ
ncbi:hypothetical protein PV410_24680 [Streptomyces sp. PA03-5A]|nr:hypothetical protein [Streptomyces sp. PA03-5A]